MYEDEMTYEQEAPRSNVLGIVGFVLSILCVTAPLGLLLSLVALRRPPRGLAIAGTIIGLIFTLIMAFVAVMAVMQWPQIKLSNEINTDMASIKVELDQAKGSATYPTSLDMLNLPADVATDPWGTAYAYEPAADGKSWTLTSAGFDAQFDTADDITVNSSMGIFDMSIAISSGIEEGRANQP